MELFFDLDGTLTNPERGITRCLRHALTSLGQPSPPVEHLRCYIGPPLRETFGELLAADDAGTIDAAIDHIPLGARLESPGVVSLRAHGRTSIESSAGSEVIAALFTSCELDGRVTNDIQKEVSQKTIANAAINPLTAMTGMEVGWVAHKRIDRLERAIIAECYADGDRPVDFRCIAR